MEQFAERLKILLEDGDKKQKALAKYLSVSEGTITNYTKGVHEPTFDSVVKIANYFHVTPDYLFAFTESREPPLTLTEEEQSLVGDFRRLHRIDRDFILQSIRVMLEK